MNLDFNENLVITLGKVLILPMLVINLIPVLIWLERKGAAYIQDRPGPQRAQILGIRLGGMIHNFADVIKLMRKQEFFPARANKVYYVLAPALVMFIYFVTSGVIPFADRFRWNSLDFSFQVTDLNVGVLYLLAMTSLAVYGVMLAGWSSNNKYSFLGALRSSSQMMSYELALGLSIVTIFMLAESVSLQDIVLDQGTLPWQWNVVRQPLAFLVFLIAIFAETNRSPFDLPEGESELVAGYHVEYSSMKFAMFFMGEYAAMIVGSALIASLFFGGWQVPFLSTQDLVQNIQPYLTNTAFGFSILSLLGGSFLVSRFKKGRYGDARDFEVLVFGLPALFAGIGTLLFLLIQGMPALPSWAGPVFAALSQLLFFLAKILFFCFLFVWVRWTVPRFRYDQLMGFGWKGLLPLSLLNIALTTLYLLYKNHS